MIELTVSEEGRRTVVRCEALLFDMDGTLVDSRSCVEGIWRAWAARHGLDADALMDVAHGRQNHETIRMVAPHLDPAAEIAFLEPAEEACRDGIVAVPGARGVVDLLPPERWAVVTSAWRRLAEIRLEAAGLPIPAVMVTADDVSRSKPHPEGYLAAAARLGVAPADCVVLEDSPAGVEAGRAAGMRVIGITTTFPRERLGCEWGVADFRSVVVSQASAWVAARSR
jgi:mannitol-1-/sugar-/sorbitol-6-phosphatase